MSASNEYTEWHLTKKGWESGTKKTDFHKPLIVLAPLDRVLSYKYFEYMSSGFNDIEKGLEEIFRCGDDNSISQLLIKFGTCPKKL